MDEQASSPTRQTQRMWEADLTEGGRRLTLDELVALEAMHQCQAIQETLTRVTQQLVLLSSLEGRLDRLEQYLERIDPRYPRSGQPDLGLILTAPRR